MLNLSNIYATSESQKSGIRTSSGHTTSESVSYCMSMNQSLGRPIPVCTWARLAEDVSCPSIQNVCTWNTVDVQNIQNIQDVTARDQQFRTFNKQEKLASKRLVNTLTCMLLIRSRNQILVDFSRLLFSF